MADKQFSTDDIRSMDRNYVWHPFTPQKHWIDEEIPVIAAADGDFLIDSDGKRYIDGTSSLWAIVHGHNHPKINQAIKDQVDRVSHSTYLGLTHPQGSSLAKKLISAAPDNLSRVFYSDSGSTAVEIALKMAFQYQRQKKNPEPERTRYLTITGAYHGDTIGSVSVGGMELFHQIFKPLLFETIQVPQPYCYHCPMGLDKDSCNLACADKAEQLIKEHGSELAAVIAEPLVQGAAGMIIYPMEYLVRLRKAARDAGTLFIADEVATGFGRTGQMFASLMADIKPDLMTFGKGLTGGYLPLAATLATEDIYEAFLANQWEAKTFFHGHTFTANPVACAAALASLELFEEENTLTNLAPKIDLLADLLAPLKNEDYVGDVRQLGVMVGIELVSDKDARAPLEPTRRLPQKIIALARTKGAIIRPLGDVIILMPTLTITENNLTELVRITSESIKEVLVV